MGKHVLRSLLRDSRDFEPDDQLYVDEEDAAPMLDSVVEVLACDLDRPAQWQRKRYLMGIQQLRDAIDALEGDIGRTATIDERYKAFKYFLEHDAFLFGDQL